MADSQPSGSDNSDVEFEGIPPKKYKQKVWNTEVTLKTDDEMQQYFGANSFWKRETESKSESVTKTYFYCNASGRVLPTRCPAELCILKREATTDYVLLRASEHVHDQNLTQKVTAQVRNKIADLLKEGHTQRMISDHLRKDANIPSKPTKNQVWI